jgi:hypothetical protein
MISLEKNLLEDAFKIIKKVNQEPSLGINNVKADFTGDGGIEFVQFNVDGLNATRFIFMVLDFDIEYFENLLT